MSNRYNADFLRKLRNEIPIDRVITMEKCSFVDAVEQLKKTIDK